MGEYKYKGYVVKWSPINTGPPEYYAVGTKFSICEGEKVVESWVESQGSMGISKGIRNSKDLIDSLRYELRYKGIWRWGP